MKGDIRREWHPLLILSLVFIFWKAFLFSVVFISPGVGYDTSTTLLGFSNNSIPDDSILLLSGYLSKLVRWDAIYYTHLAQEGHIYEQEWALAMDSLP